MSGGANGLIYREYRPPTALAGVVECFWRREPWRPPDHDLGVLPDGRVDLIWGGHGEAFVIGPQTRALGRPARAQVAVVGVRFPPGIGPPLLGVPAHELADLHVALDAIDARPAVSLLRDLAVIEDPAQAPALIASAVAKRVDSDWHWSPDPVVRRAAALLEHPEARVERVADELSLSERQLQRRFSRRCGLRAEDFAARAQIPATARGARARPRAGRRPRLDRRLERLLGSVTRHARDP
jgi:AraC-like DNA-binding protein